MSLLRRARGRDDEGAARWIVVGLGNPGDRYERTRHNAGAVVVDELLRRNSASFRRHKTGCLVAEAGAGDGRYVLARPVSYMNESGRPVAQLVRWYKASPDRLIVVHDEIDIPFGDIRVKWGGGTAGHNGLRSIAAHLGTNDFARVRFGVSRPGGHREAADHVLAEFSNSERRSLPDLISTAADVVERILEVGVERTMNEVNTRT